MVLIEKVNHHHQEIHNIQIPIAYPCYKEKIDEHQWLKKKITASMIVSVGLGSYTICA
jgi:hypothetical protein